MIFDNVAKRPEHHHLEPRDISLIEKTALDENGCLRVLPAEAYDAFPQEEISQFCVKHGFYCLPTEELIDFLQMEIGHMSAIEIASGNGVIANALNIKATDNRMQEWPEIKALYQQMQNNPIRYGQNVEELDGLDAIKKYKPRVVIASWLTHKYDPAKHELGGNQYGIDEKQILKRVHKYILIGNYNVHRNKPIMNKHTRLTVYQPDWLVGRSMHSDLNAIFIWKGNR